MKIKINKISMKFKNKLFNHQCVFSNIYFLFITETTNNLPTIIDNKNDICEFILDTMKSISRVPYKTFKLTINNEILLE